MTTMEGKESKIGYKRITKSCKSCNKQVPTACKACPCGFRFRKALTNGTVSDSSSAVPEAAKSGRIQRTRRERPHFFDSLEYGTHIRRTSSVVDPNGSTTCQLKSFHWYNWPGSDEKRVQSSAIDETGSKVHRWSRASAAARVAKNKLGVRKFKIDTQARNVTAQSVAGPSALSFGSTKEGIDSILGTGAKDTGNSTGGSSSSCSSRDEDAHCGLSSEKALHYSIILAEINRKYSSVTFRPD